MNNKNQRIANILTNMASNFRYISCHFENLSKILLENDSIPSQTVLTAAGVPPKCAPANDDWKEEMTREINEGNCRRVAEALKKSTLSRAVTPTTLPSNCRGVEVNRLHGSVRLKEIRKNAKSIYYKIETGSDCGAVLRVNRAHQKVDFDGRYQGRFNHSSSHIATVTYDKDGKDYVNRVIRARLNVGKNRVKLVRMYRPKGYAGRFTHCDIYKA